ncbi:MAG TPA: T9SS type A sorting domain-containing protein, partial [Cytophaga sp.]|nr:T9SS type A sorting domain-containing protein [Cytophaga sp.]
TYSYTDANGCSDSYTVSTTILQAPIVSISLNPNNSSYSVNDPGVEIGGTQANPSSGGIITLSGNGVSNSTGLFVPSAAGVGTHTLTRTLKAPNGCAASDTRDVTVTNSNTVYMSGLNDTYCSYSAPSNLTSAFPNATFSGPGIVPASVNSATSSAVFDPSLVDFTGQQTTILIFVTIDISGVSFPVFKLTTIYKRPQVNIIQDTIAPNFRTIFCNQDDIVPISVSTFPSGGTGVFSGTPAISGNNFNPANATIGVNTNSVVYTYTDLNGCTNTDSKTVIVNAVTKGLDFTGLNSKYCDKGSVVPLTPTNGGAPFAGGFFSGIGIDGSTFNPAIAAQYNGGAQSMDYSIIYTYVNGDKCQTVVQKTTKINLSPEVTLSGFNASKEYCYGNDSIKLSGTPSNGASGIGVFSIKAVSSTLFDPTKALDAGYFYPNKTTNPGTYRILYKYTDNTSSCTNIDSATVIVHELPGVTFTSLDTLYCIYDNPVLLDGSPAQTQGTIGIYSSIGSTAAITSNKFQPGASGVGKHVITYAYTDKNGCSSSVTKITRVYGRPDTLGIKLSTACENDLITFSDLSSKLTSPDSARSVIKTADWRFDNIAYTNDFKVDTTFRLQAGTHVITYKLTTNKGCSTQFDSTVIIGSYPETGFTWDKICNKEDTKFINTTGIVQGKVTSVVWNFGDGTALVPITLQTLNPADGNTVHKFQNASDDLPSTYTVVLTATTDYNCVHTETQKVFILPSQKIFSATPYVNDFNANNGGWIASSPGDSLLSWVLNSPNKKYIKSGNPAWVTNDTKAFKPNEISYVYSPCFTLDDDITKPMIHMDIWSGTRKNVAGANIQYSVDGTNFLTLGKANESGINWYNNESNIASRPSGISSLDQNGWTGIDSVGWKNARHIFDNEIGTNKNIRFRVSFAATADTTTDGFAFDNVWIGDRTRLILTEHFTNNSSLNTIYENDTLNKLIAANLLNNEPKDIIKLEYHTAFPGTDQINVRNIPDAGARSLYYGVTQIPYTSVDGSYFNGNTLRVNQNMIDTRCLYDPAFEVLLAPSLNASTNTISGSVTIKNKIPVTNNVTVYISMLERFVNGVTGSNNESSYQWVHAKFLPDAAGTTFAPNWSTQNSQVVNFNWNFGTNYLYNPDKLAIIAFVQDNVTKEIYQAAYKGLGSSVTTGVFNPIEATSTVTLYPNPANDLTAVILNGKLAGEYNWVIIDDLGRTVGQGTLTDGTDGFTINTQSYANGFYTLRISNSNDGVKTQKFVVLH